MLTGVAAFSLYRTVENEKLAVYSGEQYQSPLIAQPNDWLATEGEAGSQVELTDARAIILQQFFERYKSPLAQEGGFAQVLVDIADKHGLDFRLLPAIAMKESGLCRVIPVDSYNCLGLGVHSRGTWTFDSYEENFRAAASILKRNYVDQGLITPEEIMSKYTPSSPNGEWARGVNQFMSEMRYNDRQLGIEEKEENNVLEYVLEWYLLTLL